LRKAAVLPVEGVGLGVHSGLDRTPLAASSELATTAGRLQFTAGTGPCLLVGRTGREARAFERVPPAPGIAPRCGRPWAC
jgi:hypothetical protein